MFFLHVDEAKRANYHANKIIIYWPPFWNKLSDDDDDSDVEIAIKKVKMIMLMMMTPVITMTKNKKSPLTISSSLMS